MEGYRGVAFDLDGTLFDHLGSATTAIRRYVRSLGQKPSDQIVSLWFTAEAEYFERWRAGQISFAEQRRQRLRRLFTALRIPVAESEDALDAAFQNYLLEYEAAWQLYPDVLDLLAALQHRGIKIGVLTNGNDDQQRSKLRRTGLLPYIDALCTSERIGYPKPDPRAFRALLQALDLSAAELIFVGDDPEHDVAAARNAGIRASLIDRRTPSSRLRDALTTAR